jgi:enoyl-CoA hydratase/carnithine racemase
MISAMDRYTTISLRFDAGVVTITIDHPPVNVISATFLREMRDVLAKLADDDTARVIVFESANSDVFIAHFDFTLIDDLEAFDDLAALAPVGLNFAQALSEQIRHQPQATIVKLRGVTRGGGSEFVLASDMCFASPTAKISQCEALMGVIAGGGGTQYLRRRIGRNRALEVMLASDLLDAKTLETYGWINRVIPSEELDVFIDRLARNIADLPAGSIEAIKRAVPPHDEADGLRAENAIYFEQFARPAAGALLRGALAEGAQTPAGERDLEGLFRRLGA